MLQRDIQQFVRTFPLGEMMRGARVCITGATGLIGSIMAKCLLALDKDVHLTLPVRNISKAHQLLPDIVDIVETPDLAAWAQQNAEFFDYIIHCAAPTSSRFFVEQPVETYRTIHDVTAQLLEMARRNGVRGFVYLSSLEVYGTISDDTQPVTESVQGYIDPLNVRSSYPMAKRATECLCHLYAQHYGLPVAIARLTQTTGAGIAPDDNRVIAQFARLAAHHEDIVLHTTGESARPYCYTTDAVSAILYILLKGKAGEAYNVANPDTYISARDMAFYLQQHFSPDINVRVEIADTNCYAPPTKLRLSVDRLKGLGWKAHYGLKEIFSNLIAYLS